MLTASLTTSMTPLLFAAGKMPSTAKAQQKILGNSRRVLADRDHFDEDVIHEAYLAHPSHAKLLPILFVTLSSACTESEGNPVDSLDLNSLLIGGSVFIAVTGLAIWLFSRRNKRPSVERTMPEPVVAQAEVKLRQLSKDAIMAELAREDTELFHRITIHCRSGYNHFFSKHIVKTKDSESDYVQPFKIEENVDVLACYHRDTQLMFLRMSMITPISEENPRRTEFIHQIAWPSLGGVIDQEIARRIFRSIYGENIFDEVVRLRNQTTNQERAEAGHLIEGIINQASKESLVASLSSIH